MSNIEHLIENGLYALSKGHDFDETMNQFPNNDMLYAKLPERGVLHKRS